MTSAFFGNLAHWSTDYLRYLALSIGPYFFFCGIAALFDHKHDNYPINSFVLLRVTTCHVGVFSAHISPLIFWYNRVDLTYAQPGQ
jgi:hypothetical protein